MSEVPDMLRSPKVPGARLEREMRRSGRTKSRWFVSSETLEGGLGDEEE